MSDTAEHRAEMVRIASERRRQGLPSWAETIDLSAFWKSEMPWEEKRGKIVAAIKASRWYKSSVKDVLFLEICVENIEESEDADEFDGYWDEFYDLADDARVWIKTF